MVENDAEPGNYRYVASMQDTEGQTLTIKLPGAGFKRRLLYSTYTGPYIILPGLLCDLGVWIKIGTTIRLRWEFVPSC